jgi:glycolate oxidase
MSKTNKSAHAALISGLIPIVGRAWVLDDPEETVTYASDALTAYRSVPDVVVLPEREDQVVAIVELCKQLNVSIVPRGAGTGLAGGVRPIAGGLVVSLARLNRIIDLDPEAGTATLEPGVRNLAISEAASPHGLFYAPDPSSQIACSIGGNVSENSGGVHCLKYGLTLHNVLKIRGVLSSGEIIEVGGESPDAPGLDLLPLIIGSEGMLLIVTEVTVRLIPKPACAKVAMASFDSIEACANAVAAIISAGIIPAGLEMMDQAATRAVEDFIHAGYDTEAAALLLVESDGTETEVLEEMERIRQVLGGAGVRSIVVSTSEAERQRIWSGRKNAFPAAGRVAPEYYCMDGTVPRRQMAPLLAHISMLERQHGLRCMNVFHAGDGNMHPLILFDGKIPGEWARAEAFGNAILEKCIALGGTVTGEHGVGVEKLDSLCVQFSDEERDVFHALKAVFDPLQILNPDKGIPTLRRCVEHGRKRMDAHSIRASGLEQF